MTQLLGLAAVLLTFGSVLVIRALFEADFPPEKAAAPALRRAHPHSERRAA